MRADFPPRGWFLHWKTDLPPRGWILSHAGRSSPRAKGSFPLAQVDPPPCRQILLREGGSFACARRILFLFLFLFPLRLQGEVEVLFNSSSWVDLLLRGWIFFLVGGSFPLEEVVPRGWVPPRVTSVLNYLDNFPNTELAKNNKVTKQTCRQNTDFTWLFSTLGISRPFGSRLEKV